MLKGTRLYSIFSNRCPRCHQGHFFKSDNPYKLSVFSEMNKKCDVCGESFLKETGYYYGAMYVSYGLNVLIGISMFLIMVVLLQLDLLVFLFSFVAGSLLFFPWVFRTSRLIWINLFVKYKPKSDPHQ